MKNKFSLIGKEVIQSEINSLKKLKNSLNEESDRHQSVPEAKDLTKVFDILW